MEVRAAEIPDVKIIETRRYFDQRGFFSETYNKRALMQAGIELDFVQDSHSRSVEKGVVRGLHYQIPPFAQDKLVRVVRGAVFDVAVDLRKRSPTFGQSARRRRIQVQLTSRMPSSIPLVQWIPDRNGFSCHQARRWEPARSAWRRSPVSAYALASTVR